VDPTHRRLAQVGLQAAARFGFALAGGYAVQEHGLIHRPSEDVDLFTGWDHRADFADAVRAVVSAYEASGYQVEVVQQFDTFARLGVVDRTQPDRPFKVELAGEPASAHGYRPGSASRRRGGGQDVGAVHPGRARDFLDVDAAVASGRYSREHLCLLAEQADSGFDRRILAEVFGMLARYPDRRLAAYGASPEQVKALRARFADWRAALLRP